MILTKHCTREARECMLSGHFKIGSHKEYSKKKDNGALSDTDEGRGGFAVKGDLNNFCGAIGTNIFDGLTITGAASGQSLVYESSINSLMFCASVGEYEPRRHLSFLNGDVAQSYEPNENYKAYLTLDLNELRKALTAATDEFFGKATKWLGFPVDYGERFTSIDASVFNGFTNDQMMVRLAKQAYLKPRKFAIEQEFRFLMVATSNSAVPEVIYTKDLSQNIQEAFRRAVVDRGAVLS